MSATNAGSKRFGPFKAFLASVGIVLGAAAPVNADPDNPFDGLSCSCDQPVPGRHRLDTQQIMQGIQEGLAVLPAPQHQYERWLARSSTRGFAKHLNKSSVPKTRPFR